VVLSMISILTFAYVASIHLLRTFYSP
jgi:hypothetical protein